MICRLHTVHANSDSLAHIRLVYGQLLFIEYDKLVIDTYVWVLESLAQFPLFVYDIP